MASDLTNEHRQQLARVTDRAAADVANQFRSADVDDIDGWWDRSSPRIEATVAQGYRQAADLGAEYLTEHAAEVGSTVQPVVTRPNDRRIRESLRISGPVAFKANMRVTGEPDAALRTMIARGSQTAQRLTAAGSRETVSETIRTAPTIIGYRRVAQPGACDFCQMLEGRGAVYSAATVARVGQKPRGNQRAGSSYHDNCRCLSEPVYESRVAPSAEAREAARAGREERRARVLEARRQAELDRMGADRAKIAGRAVDPDLARQWGVSERQVAEARAVADQIKRDIRDIAKREADELGSWLTSNDLGHLTRPKRVERVTDIGTGRARSARTQSGYDFLETLDDGELARIRKRMIDSDLHSPDVIAEQVRRKTNLDMSDDEALDWLIERWLHEDGLRSVASGRIPKYADPDNLIPGEYGLEGYDIAKLFGTRADDAAGHVAAVQQEQAQQFAFRALGDPQGVAPWRMDPTDFVNELEELEDFVASVQLQAGVDPGAGFREAQQRLRELAPRDIDPDGTLSPIELHEQIRLTAQTAGLL